MNIPYMVCPAIPSFNISPPRPLLSSTLFPSTRLASSATLKTIALKIQGSRDESFKEVYPKGPVVVEKEEEEIEENEVEVKEEDGRWS